MRLVSGGETCLFIGRTNTGIDSDTIIWREVLDAVGVQKELGAQIEETSNGWTWMGPGATGEDRVLPTLLP